LLEALGTAGFKVVELSEEGLIKIVATLGK
jgi:hypothetical protein